MFKSCSTLFGLILLSACTTSLAGSQNISSMNCSEVMHEIEHLDVSVKSSSQNNEVARAADTGTTVAATGAGMAGVPYVGGVVSIGKALFRHNRESSSIKSRKAQERLYTLNDAAYSKGCYE